MKTLSGAKLVALVCSAQVLVQIGANFWPALLPSMMDFWGLTNSEAGWITGVFYLAYMLAVPLLVTLTDRIDARLVYLFGVACTISAHVLFGLFAEGFWSAFTLRALAGIGWAGTYMTGLKLLADLVDKRMMSRAVAGHAASIGVSGALSFSCAALLTALFDWRTAFVIAGLFALAAWMMVALWVPPRSPAAAPALGQKLFDFGPVLRNKSAMAYSIAYCVHTLEMNALRGWGVAFLGFVGVSTGAGHSLLSPPVVLTILGVLGTAASVMGNEAAIRMGRRNLIGVAMLGSVLIGGTIGYFGSLSYPLAVAMMILYGFIVWLDSSSLTAGAAGTADPARRGAQLAVHSSLGYAGGFVGPLIIGFILDAAGGMSRVSWSLAFLSIAGLMALALATFWAIRPQELAGDRAAG
ncbi:MAG TPA: MFS transporter [Burkholderiales bacterium]|nr:MFS transporter [Burkholderiales bacterium]